MRQTKQLKMWLIIASIMWVLFASTFLLMKPAVEGQPSLGKSSVVLLGLSFWAFLALAVLSLIIAMVYYRKICRKKRIILPGAPGVVTFFSNPFAVVIDFLLIISVVVSILLIVFRPDNQYLYFVDLFLLALTVPFHCISNGKMVRVFRLGKNSGRKKR